MNLRFGFAAALACAGVAYGASDVAKAAERRDFTAVRSLIGQKANVNETLADGSSALLWAVHWNDVEAARALIKAGADVKATNRLGSSPLSEAAALGSASLIQLLLDAGADAKALSTPDGETVLMTAARAGNVDAVRLLIDRGADLNAKEQYKGQTALMWAAAERHSDVVKLLLDRGADWKVQSGLHETKMPKLSAASSVTPMARGGLTALSFAAREGDIATAKVMLDYGVDINIVDGEKTSPLVIALMNKQYTFAKFLLDRGANPNIADTFGRAALFAAIDIRNEDYSALPRRPQSDPMPSLDIIQAIVAKGANLNQPLVQKLPGRSGMDTGDATMGDGSTPLMRAARAGDNDVIKVLLKAGADPTLKTKAGDTALLFAAGVGYRDKSTTGTESGALESLKTLIAAGQPLDQSNARGETALHGAAGRGADLIAQFLIDQKVDLNARTRLNQTPLDVAMGKGSFGLPVPHDSTVALLKKAGAKEGQDLPPAPGIRRAAEAKQ